MFYEHVFYTLYSITSIFSCPATPLPSTLSAQRVHQPLAQISGNKNNRNSKSGIHLFVQDFGAFVVDLFGDEEGEGPFGGFPDAIRRCAYGALFGREGGGV